MLSYDDIICFYPDGVRVIDLLCPVQVPDAEPDVAEVWYAAVGAAGVGAVDVGVLFCRFAEVVFAETLVAFAAIL